ncbi:MAG: protein kinase [Herminiimonas sp.]|nr:protein kinase [Herminiimonas sp.]
MNDCVIINQMPSGVPGLDRLLGGGLPEFSFNIIAGATGSRKNTLAHQIMFAQAAQQRRSLYFTVLGEPALKMLRYQQQFPFFDVGQIGDTIKFVNLTEDIAKGDFDRVLKRIVDEVTAFAPSFVFVDSFRSVVQSVRGGTQKLQQFVHQLAMQMTGWRATAFLVGEYLLPEAESSPVFTVADGILWLSQNLHRNAMVRRIQIFKVRGQEQVPGWHTFHISKEGVHVFPRAIVGPVSAGGEADDSSKEEGRISIGTPSMDRLMGGGLPIGYSLLVVGPSGSGKTILATEFLTEGARNGEFGVVAAFEKRPSQLLSGKLDGLIKAGKVGVINTRSLDLSMDETLHNLIEMIEKKEAKRLVIDSLSGFELALAPEFSEDFRGVLYRMMAVLTSMGVAIFLTSELEDWYLDLRFSPYGNAFLADAILMLRYIEIEGDLKRVISVVKVRASAHSKSMHLFDITDDGIQIGEPLSTYRAILTGRPQDTTGNGSFSAEKIL